MDIENDGTSIAATMSGDLDDFLNANGPLSVTIKTDDKTTTEMSFLTSPDLVTLLPLPESSPENLSIHSSHDMDVDGVVENNHSFSEARNLVRVKIESSVEQNSDSFYVSVPMILQREVEMQGAARANGIGKERWTSSRIFRMWKSQCVRQQQRVQTSTQHQSRETKINDYTGFGEIILRMTPEVSLHNTSSSCSLFRWKPWLTTCIRSYYSTGNLRIPDECTGDDILLAMEYFGILTSSSDNFVFDSRHAYDRIKAWSRYFTHRADLAESFLEAYDDAEVVDRGTLEWVLVEEKDCTENDHCYQYAIIRDGENIEQLKSEDLIPDSTTVQNFTVKAAGGLYELLSDVKESERANYRESCVHEECETISEGNMLSKTMPSRMRHDFCRYLSESLPPWSEVRFTVERVKTTPIIKSNRDELINATVQAKLVICIDRNQNEISKPIRYHKQNELSISDSTCRKIIAGNDRTVLTCSSDDQFELNCGYADQAKSLLQRDKNNADTTQNLFGVERPKKGHTNHNIGSGRNFDMIEGMQNANTPEIEAFTEISSHTPITYVNMEIGDLRSVTSVLSEPIVGNAMKSKLTSVNHEENKEDQVPPNLFTAKQIVRKRSGGLEQKAFAGETKTAEQPFSSFQQQGVSRSKVDLGIETPPRTIRNLLDTPPWDLDSYSYEEKFRIPNVNWGKGDNSQNTDEVYAALYDEGTSNIEHVAEVKTAWKRRGDEWEEENSDSKSGGRATDLHDSWGQILASMCEAMIPVDSRNIISSSPTRNFTVTSNKSTAFTVVSSDEHQSSYRSRSNDKPEFIYKPTGFVDQAKKFGNDLSDQFDELMKIAYNEIDQEGMNRPNGLEVLSPIFEEVPEILAIDTDEDHTLSSCLTTSIVGQPCKIRGSEPFQTLREKDEEYLSGVVTLSSDTAYFTPRSQPFELFSSNNGEVDKPHRTIRTPDSVRQDISVTTKKSTREILRDDSENDACARKGFISKGYAGRASTSCYTSSISEEFSGISLKSYNKHNRYSRRKNRFYS